jgi:hypothetical protein
MRITSYDIWTPVWVTAGIIMCACGVLSWWVFAFVASTHINLTVTRK